MGRTKDGGIQPHCWPLNAGHINRTITDSEEQDMAKYEAAQLKIGPRCGTTVRSRFLPVRIVHDKDKCDRKLTGTV
jgi:hypothetical protein